jgi:hypothetical protein
MQSRYNVSPTHVVVCSGEADGSFGLEVVQTGRMEAVRYLTVRNCDAHLVFTLAGSRRQFVIEDRRMNDKVSLLVDQLVLNNHAGRARLLRSSR